MTGKGLIDMISIRIVFLWANRNMLIRPFIIPERRCSNYITLVVIRPFSIGITYRICFMNF